MTRYVKPIGLPPPQTGEWMTSGEKIHICGWGDISHIGTNFATELHCTDTVYVSQSECNSKGHYNGQLLSGSFEGPKSTRLNPLNIGIDAFIDEPWKKYFLGRYQSILFG